MKRLLLFAQFFAFISVFPALAISPESPRSQKAVYNEADNSVTVSATAPTTTEFDYETYQQFELTHISYIQIFRHETGTGWGDKEYKRLENVKPGEEFKFTDTDVEKDKRYEYQLICFVDAEHSTSVYASVYTGVLPGAPLSFTAMTANHNAN